MNRWIDIDIDTNIDIDIKIYVILQYIENKIYGTENCALAPP